MRLLYILLIITNINVIIGKMFIFLCFYKIKNNILEQKLSIFKEKFFNLIKKYQIYYDDLDSEEKKRINFIISTVLD
jgi:hypothetical protein